MNKKITVKQLKVLEIIYEEISTSGFAPTINILRERLGVVSNQSIMNFLQALEEKGHIRKEEGVARGIRILPLGYKALGKEALIPAAGSSSCGPFIEDIQAVGNWMILPGAMNEVKESQDKLYVIQVHGDSMINAGIHDGDLLLVKQSKEYKNGDIVVARSDDGSTVKRFVAENKRAYLKPENPAFKNIPIFEDTYFEGKIIANLSTLKRIYGSKN